MVRRVVSFLHITLPVVFLATVLTADNSSYQPGSVETPCNQQESRQFDFWIGEWDLTWGEDAEVGAGTNVITAELDSCVIEENFTALEDEPFVGKSVSVYDSESGLWKQTWVDNHGNYLDFDGGFRDGKMILQRRTHQEDEEIWQRMVWYNISDDSLDWNWEKSTDGGQNWQVLWKIHYLRNRPSRKQAGYGCH